jgi:hypothetical protein
MSQNKYTDRLVQHVAAGGIIVPLRKCALAKSFSYLTIRSWVDRGVFPIIKVGARAYTSDEVVSEWISDGQMDPSLFGSKTPGAKPGTPFPKRKDSAPVEEEVVEAIEQEDF